MYSKVPLNDLTDKNLIAFNWLIIIISLYSNSIN